MPQETLTVFLVFALVVSMIAIVWLSLTRRTLVREEREHAFDDLERRVSERTEELSNRNLTLRDAEGRLREDDRRKDEFLATVAHELRNPLTPIRSAVAVLRADGATAEDRDRARAILDRQVTQMARLIDDLLDVSRITAGKLPMRRQVMPLNDIIDLAIAMVRPHLDAARHRFDAAVPSETIYVDADEARLAQVIANLLHNACKYTEPGGEILLAVSQPNDGDVAIAVRDNGMGIPPECLPHLFRTFFQVDNTLERSQGGMGIGLSLVRGIVAMHDGWVEARSAGPGRGSEFIVHLPAAHPDDTPADLADTNHARRRTGDVGESQAGVG